MESIQILAKYQYTDGAKELVLKTIVAMLRKSEKHFGKRMIEHMWSLRWRDAMYRAICI